MVCCVQMLVSDWRHGEPSGRGKLTLTNGVVCDAGTRESLQQLGLVVQG